MTNPKILGRYQIEAHLGAGAFADVYKALDTVLNRVVALKVLKPMLLADSEAFVRFTREAQVAANLFHPHIATVLDMGEAEGRYFIAMRFVDGKSLEKVLAERSVLPWDETLKITEQIAGALQFAHDKGLVHRDVKPQNIIVSESEGAVLTDFGLVKALHSSGMSSTTSMIGTPAYIPPEIWEGEAAGPASDQYALACVLVEMLTGKVLFDGTTPAIMKKHLLEALPLPERLPDGLPENIASVIQRSLVKDPGGRFTNMTDFMQAMQKTEGRAEVGEEIERLKTQADYYYRRGMSYQKKGDYDRAIAEHTKAIELDPTQAGYYYSRGDSYHGKSDYDHAIADETKAIELDPTKAVYYFSRGVDYIFKGDYDRAIADATKAIELDPTLANHYSSRGVSYAFKGDHDRAIADYTRAIELNPTKADFYGKRGVSYFDKGDYDRAIAEHTKAIELNPLNAGYYYSRGASYSEKSDYDHAIADYTIAIELDPTQAGYYFSRGVNYKLKRDYNRAIADYTKAIELDPTMAVHYSSRGVSYELKRDYNRAIADYTKAIELDPSKADYYYSRSRSYRKKGNTARANDDLAKARELGYKD